MFHHHCEIAGAAPEVCILKKVVLTVLTIYGSGMNTENSTDSGIQGDVTFEANWGQYYARSTTTGGYVSVGNQKLADLVRLSLHLQFLHAGIIPQSK